MRLQVIGDPVLHSKSPVIHSAMLAMLGLEDITYTARVVRRGELLDYFGWARETGVVGFNATMPHKEDLVPLMDGLDEAARAIGSVNTVCLRNGKMWGHSTDGPGFLAALENELHISPAGRTIILLGAGGAARAVACALARAGAARVYVCNRTQERAAALCALDSSGRLIPAGFDGETLRRLSSSSDLLVNCTNLGMEGCPGQFADFSFLDALPRAAAVYDLIYHPAETELLRQANYRGLSTNNGLSMLVWQAVLALEYFLDRPLRRLELAHAAAAALLEDEGETYGALSQREN